MSNGLQHIERQPNHGVLHKEFAWLLLQPGPGHIEMNMLKTYVKTMWTPFWETVVEVFNFKSDTAKRAAFSVTDHHKGMTLAKIIREAMAKELVLTYVRKQLAHSAEISVAGYFKFCMLNVKSHAYAFMCDSILEVLDGIFLYRAGLRSGVYDLIEAGFAHVAPFWSARPHPKYCQLDVHHSLVMTCAPPEVKVLLQNSTSFSLSGIPYSGEGADFKLEEANRGVQHWIPAVPHDDDWKSSLCQLLTAKRLAWECLKRSRNS